MVGNVIRSILFFCVVTVCGAGAGLIARFTLVGEAFTPRRGEWSVQFVRDGDDALAVEDLNSASHLGVNHDRVKRSFRDVVTTANRNTVRVRVEGKQVALGAIVSPDGWIVTKASELGTPLTCLVPGGRSYPAEFIEHDEDTDLALIKIDCQGLEPAVFDDLELPIGSWVCIPGGSGDFPLVVGVVSAATRDLEAETAMLGIEPQDSHAGPVIHRVMKKSVAERIGLKQGDIVKRINGTELRSSQELIRFIRGLHEGDLVKLSLHRKGETVEINARLGSATALMQSSEGLDGFERGPTSHRLSGFPEVIQHDCLLLPQQCGGPAVDLDGRIVGLNIARAGRIATYALPSKLVSRRVATLLEQARRQEQKTPTTTVGIGESNE